MDVLFIGGKVHSFPRASFRSETVENSDEHCKLRFKSKCPNETLFQAHTEVCGMIEFNLPSVLPGVNTFRELLLV